MSVFGRLNLPFSNLQPITRRRSSTTSDDLDPSTKDEIFTWQLGAKDFCAIEHETLIRAQIVENKSYATKVLAGAKKCCIIDASTGQPNTARVSRDIAKSMPLISVMKQKELVMLLFFWEEEIVRWNLLCVEEVELKTRLEDGENVSEELSFVQAKKRVPPSLRDQSGRVDQSRQEVLPTYEEARRERYR